MQFHLLSIPDSYHWEEQHFEVLDSFVIGSEEPLTSQTLTAVVWARHRDNPYGENYQQGADFSVHIGPRKLAGQTFQATELSNFTDWLDPFGRFNFSEFSPSSTAISATSLRDSMKQGLIQESEDFHLVPVLGRGSTGGFELELLASNLIWLGAGLLASEVRTKVPKLYSAHQLKKEARLACTRMKARGIYATETLRRWAASKDAWTTHEGCKQLDVSRELMSEIFYALGYRLRETDQVWQLSELPEDRIRRQVWIDAEPELVRIEEERQSSIRSAEI